MGSRSSWPLQTIPQPGTSWQPHGDPRRQAAEYVRNGTAQLLTLFHPASGQVRVKGVTICPNTVLHLWLQAELTATLAQLPAPTLLHDAAQTRQQWERWQADLTVRFTLPAVLPSLRMLVVLDHLAGHQTPAFVLWLVEYGIMPRYTPLSGSWLNRRESIQRIIARRALAGHHLTTPQAIIDCLEAVVQHWNRAPTPFCWGGKRRQRRMRARQRRHALGGSAAYTRCPIRRTRLEQWRQAEQGTH